MPESRKSLDVKKKRECEHEASVCNPKTVILLSILMFILAILIARFLVALQRAGFIGDSPLIFLGFHLHHWAFSLVIIMLLVPVASHFRKNGKIFAILIIITFFFVGLFVEGIMYENSVIFFE